MAAAAVEPMGDDKIKIATITWNVGDGKKIGSKDFTLIDNGIKDFIQNNEKKDIIVICLQEVKYNTKDSNTYIENLSKQFINYNIIKNIARDDKASKARKGCTVACQDDFGIFTIILYKKDENLKVRRIDESKKTDTAGIESIKYDKTLSKSISKLMTGGAKELAYSFVNEDFKMVRFIPLFIKKNNKYSILLIGNGHLPFKNPDEDGKEKLISAFKELNTKMNEVIRFLRKNSNEIPICSIILGDYNSRSTYLPFEGSESHIQLIMKAGKNFDGILSAVKKPIELLEISKLPIGNSKPVKSQNKAILDNTLTEKEKKEEAINELKNLINDRNNILETKLNQFKELFLTKTGFTEKKKDYNELVENIVSKDVLSNILKEYETDLKESEITFLPSYKFDKKTGNYSLQKKGEIRLCGHADRILYAGDKIKPEDNNKYTCHLDYEGSDHKPISNMFELELESTEPVKNKSIRKSLKSLGNSIKSKLSKSFTRKGAVKGRKSNPKSTYPGALPPTNNNNQSNITPSVKGTTGENTSNSIVPSKLGSQKTMLGGSRKQTKKQSKKKTYKKKNTKKVK